MKWPFGKLGVGSALALVGVLALVGGALSLAFHESSGAGSVRNSATATRDRDAPPGMGMRFRRLTPKQILDRRKKFHAALAKELGVSTGKVDKAFRDLFARRLNAAVASHRLTRSQANRILSCYDTAACKPPFRHRLRFRGSMRGPPPPGGPGGPGEGDFGPPPM